VPALTVTPPALRATDPVDRLPGLGPTSRAVLAERGIATVADLLWTLPVAWDDMRAPCSIREAVAAGRAAAAEGVAPGRVCVRAIVKSASLVPMRGRRTARVVFEPPPAAAPVAKGRKEPAELLYTSWFFAAHGVLAAATPGKACLILGRLRIDEKGRAQMAHPDVVSDVPGAASVRPRYARLGVPEAALRKALSAALAGLAEVPDPVPLVVGDREHFPAAAPLLRAAHGNAGALTEPPSDETRRALHERLAWAEAFVRVWDRLKIEGTRGRAVALARSPAVQARLRAELRFTLTGAQSRAIDAIAKDLARDVPMRRLLLGDVGTGKTAVALAAAAQCVAAGYQVAILAPTTVLAEQTMDAVLPLARATGAPIALVAGEPTAARQRALEQIAAGKITVAVGTHALLAEGVTFARLGLVIVDEQQRLGVAQRLALVQKGRGGAGGNAAQTWPHLLTLSATPIPRTMALALRGELATSLLDERPAGRLPNATEMRPEADLAAVVEEVRAAAARGERAFWVCPRIDEDADDAGAAVSATARAGELTSALGPDVTVTLIHGGMRPQAKRAAMRAFRSGKAQVLVGTTVVEVGVDVPEATLMVIEGAEGFGLAQLHQLRGRVGRGDRPGRCILLHRMGATSAGPPGVAPAVTDPSLVARRRLEALCALATGAEIARADLELRGAGDLGGTRQSGEAEGLLYLDLASPPDWLARVESDARAILAADPRLAEPAHTGLALFVRRLEAAIAVRDEAG